MLFNEKIDYLIKLGMKVNSNFKKDITELMKKLPITIKSKLSGNEGFEFSFLGTYVNFGVWTTNNETSSVELDFSKSGLLKKEEDFSFEVELPNEEKIKTLEINTLEDVIDTNVDIYDVMMFEFSNSALNKEYSSQFEAENVNKLYEFDFVKTKDTFYLVCKESVEDLEEELFISKTALQLTEEDLNIIVINENKELISE